MPHFACTRSRRNPFCCNVTSHNLSHRPSPACRDMLCLQRTRRWSLQGVELCLTRVSQHFQYRRCRSACLAISGPVAVSERRAPVHLVLVRINVLQHWVVLQVPRDLPKPRLRDLQRLCNRAHHRLRAEKQIGPIHADVHDEPGRPLGQLRRTALQLMICIALTVVRCIGSKNC